MVVAAVLIGGGGDSGIVIVIVGGSIVDIIIDGSEAVDGGTGVGSVAAGIGGSGGSYIGVGHVGIVF